MSISEINWHIISFSIISLLHFALTEVPLYKSRTLPIIQNTSFPFVQNSAYFYWFRVRIIQNIDAIRDRLNCKIPIVEFCFRANYENTLSNNTSLRASTTSRRCFRWGNVLDPDEWLFCFSVKMFFTLSESAIRI